MTNPSSTGQPGAPTFHFNRVVEHIRHRTDLGDTLIGTGA